MSALNMPKAPKGYNLLQLPTRGGQSADIYSQLAGGLQAGGGVQDLIGKLLGMAGGAPGAFQGLENQALSHFNQVTAPGIAQRYAGSGIAGSSGIQNAIAGAGANLEQDLQAKRVALMQQSMHDVLGLGNMLLARPDVEFEFQKKDPAWWRQLLGIGAPIAGAALGGAFGGGPAGALAGAKAGSAVGRAFQG